MGHISGKVFLVEFLGTETDETLPFVKSLGRFVENGVLIKN